MHTTNNTCTSFLIDFRVIFQASFTDGKHYLCGRRAAVRCHKTGLRTLKRRTTRLPRSPLRVPRAVLCLREGPVPLGTGTARLAPACGFHIDFYIAFFCNITHNSGVRRVHRCTHTRTLCRHFSRTSGPNLAKSCQRWRKVPDSLGTQNTSHVPHSPALSS